MDCIGEDTTRWYPEPRKIKFCQNIFLLKSSRVIMKKKKIAQYGVRTCACRKYLERAGHYKNKKIAQYETRTCACRKYLEREYKDCASTDWSTVWTLTQNFRHFNKEKHCLNSDPAVTLHCLEHCPDSWEANTEILSFWWSLFEHCSIKTVFGSPFRQCWDTE